MIVLHFCVIHGTLLKRLHMLSGGEERRGLRCLATESGVSPDEENPCI